MHDSGADNYDSQLAVAILDTLGTAYTFEHKGHTSGTFSSGSRNDDWVNAGFNENIANHWGQMKFAAYSRVFNYDSEVASAIQDAVADALKKLVQAGIQAGVNAVIALITA
jgi:flagellar biosynthesis/type III secretory pathway protein FliH